ncbi:unnamed protein product [Calicophoron daubneyi]|uniref:Uncharacterized protein n=1 Tax=Calicophoron daubneyi TaxID=300641 RepID=A0AAV2TLP3_CALDB
MLIVLFIPRLKNANGIGPVLFGEHVRKEQRGVRYVEPRNVNWIKQNKSKIKSLEEAFLKHPLHLFSYIQESLPTREFREALTLLDPNMTTPVPTPDTRTKNLDFVLSNYGNLRLAQRIKRTEYVDVKQPEIFIENPQLREDCNEYCKWIKELDNKEQDNPEATTIASLFAGIHEALPEISTPISVAELLSLPPELQQKSSEPPVSLTDKEPIGLTYGLSRQTKSKASRQAEQKFEKIHYGAWYIPAKLWTSSKLHQLSSEKPESVVGEKTELDNKVKAIDEKLIQTHGFKSFKEYIEAHGKRMPEFMKVSWEEISETEGKTMTSQA